MITEYLMGISVVTLILWLLHKYAVYRAKYLVHVELGSPTGSLDDDETLKEVAYVFKPKKPFEVKINGRGVTNKVVYQN